MIFCCTKTCRSHGHPEIRVACDEVFRDDAALLLQGFEQEVARGVVYKEGETIQIGWMICRFALLTDGTLELREPDFTSFPIQFVDTVNRTFAHVVGQREAHSSVGLVWDTTLAQNSICDSALICDRVFSAEEFMMVREVPKGNDSGWFLGCLGDHNHNSPRNLKRESLYEIGRRFPAAIDLIMLPPGITLAYSKADGFTVYRDGVLLPVVPGSYLDVRWKRAQEAPHA